MKNTGAFKSGLSLSSVKVMLRVIDAQLQDNLIGLSAPEKWALRQLQAYYTQHLQYKNQQPCLSLKWGRRAKQACAVVELEFPLEQEVLPFKDTQSLR